MPYCPKCGVEVKNKKCPLCSYTIKQDIHYKPFSHKIEVPLKRMDLSRKDKLSIYNMTTWFFSILVASICFTVDILVNQRAGWSLFPIISVTTLALITTIAIYVKKILKTLLIIGIIAFMLFAFDLAIPNATFSLRVSLPILFMISVLSLGVVILSVKSSRKGANIAGYILLSLAILSIGIDIIIKKFLGENISITWSLLVAVSLVPIASFLLYIHHVLSKKIDLRKIFHT
ncbi:MAG: hypothetical protein B6229_01920 [Spirochaetaceae bacterium 4572_7]|nr:MAG: hypothetical protein B6229_01920 [Spirochaetaceae bacterium 4572_7]